MGASLIICGSIGVNYYNRLLDLTCVDSNDNSCSNCKSDDIPTGDFGKTWAIILIVIGCIHALLFIGRLIIFIKTGGKV